MTHVPAARLAQLWREGLPFPAPDEPHSAMGFEHILQARIDLGLPEFTGKYICNGDYIEFLCLGCNTYAFAPNTDRGINFEHKIARNHPLDCCAEREEEYQRTGIMTAWPDTEDE